MRPPKSDIPAGVKERVVRPYSEERNEAKNKWIGPSSLIKLETRECICRGKVAGRRSYDREGRLSIETPLKDGKKHGREIFWNEDGTVNFIEPYFDGKIHGTAKQYQNGRLIGTYKMIHGTGDDVWRTQIADGPIYVSEIHSNRDGLFHGFVWWLEQDQQSVHEEKHFREGHLHGIEREWNFAGILRRGFPKYWVNDRAVTKRQYIAAERKDPTLPPFRLKDNSPKREFSPEIRRLLKAPMRK